MLKFFIYSLYRKETVEDWENYSGTGEVPVKEELKLVDRKVVNDSCDNICIGAYGKDGKYYQYDSQEALYASMWFKNDEEKHGLVLEYKQVGVNPDSLIECN